MSEMEKLELIIAALIPFHPEILEMKDPRDLFQIEGFALPEEHDLTFYSASVVLFTAQMTYKTKGYKFTAERIEPHADHSNQPVRL